MTFRRSPRSIAIVGRGIAGMAAPASPSPMPSLTSAATPARGFAGLKASLFGSLEPPREG
jgi:hypothetical protein